VGEVRRRLDADPSLLDLGDASGASPLHRAVRKGSMGTIAVLLGRGANVHAFQGAARGLAGGLWRNLQAVDLAIRCGGGPDAGAQIARLLVTRGATYDLTVAAALGDAAQVRQMLDADPSRIAEHRPCGRRPLSAAVEFGQGEIVRLLLERGADPTWDEPTAPRGLSLHEAAHAGNRALVELLLAHGADPNSTVDSSGSATWIASTPEIRDLLVEHGGTLDPFLIWLDKDDEAMRSIAENPQAACLADAFTDDESWATPLAWADRRGHSQVASLLRAQGAVR